MTDVTDEPGLTLHLGQLSRREKKDLTSGVGPAIERIEELVQDWLAAASTRQDSSLGRHVIPLVLLYKSPS